jgi:hypothetical protein
VAAVTLNAYYGALSLGRRWKSDAVVLISCMCGYSRYDLFVRRRRLTILQTSLMTSNLFRFFQAHRRKVVRSYFCSGFRKVGKVYAGKEAVLRCAC